MSKSEVIKVLKNHKCSIITNAEVSHAVKVHLRFT